jgi:hypothetical protein
VHREEPSGSGRRQCSHFLFGTRVPPRYKLIGLEHDSPVISLIAACLVSTSCRKRCTNLGGGCYSLYFSLIAGNLRNEATKCFCLQSDDIRVDAKNPFSRHLHVHITQPEDFRRRFGICQNNLSPRWNTARWRLGGDPASDQSGVWKAHWMALPLSERFDRTVAEIREEKRTLQTSQSFRSSVRPSCRHYCR